MLEFQEQVLLAPLTTFDIGGAARYFVEVRNQSNIVAALAWAHTHGMKFVILGGGSNVLMPDAGLNALVIHIAGDSYSIADCTLLAWAGTNLLGAIKACGKKGFGGWERLSGIPGSIGGAARGNAGAFGSELQDFITSVWALNADTGEEREFQNAACDFSYRHSFFKDHPEWIITRVELRLVEVASVESERLSEETIAEREKRHLQNVKAAGSYFTNPVAPQEIVKLFEKEKQVSSRGGRVPAGWLIDSLGLKGTMVGDAIVSHQHADYIVNLGTATANQVQELAKQVRAAVKSRFGIELQEEAAIF